MARTLPYGFRQRDTQQVVNANAAALASIETSVDTIEPLVTAHETQLGPTGTATIANATSTVTVTHNFGASGYRATATPTADLGTGQRFWISNQTNNAFDLNLSAAAVGAKTFAWIVRGS